MYKHMLQNMEKILAIGIAIMWGILALIIKSQFYYRCLGGSIALGIILICASDFLTNYRGWAHFRVITDGSPPVIMKLLGWGFLILLPILALLL